MRKNHKATARFDRFSIAVWTTWLIPYMCRMLMGIPIINLSANAAFGVALIGADVISLALYLRWDARRVQPPAAEASHETGLLLTLNYDESFIRLPGIANHADTKLPSRTAALTTSSKEMSDA